MPSLFFFVLIPVCIEIPNHDNFGPEHFAPNTRNTQTAFFKSPVVTGFFNDFGVDKYFF